MALETLKGIKHLDGFDVVVMDELREKYPEKFNESGAMDYAWFEKDIRPNNFIYLRHDKNSISFTLQNGPIKENGVNGCQVDTLIAAVMEIMTALDRRFPCHENAQALYSLRSAYDWLKQRKLNREQRGVEGENKV